MAINSNVKRTYQTAEYGKFVELINDSNFPPVSVIRWSYPDTTSAFPGNSAALPVSSVDVYPKYAILTYSVNGGGGGGGSTDLTFTNTLIAAITATTNRINGFVIPDYNRIANTYYGTSNNLSQVDYKMDSTVVASLSFTYVTPTSADNALLAEVIKIL